jgi:hypothetical protein
VLIITSIVWNPDRCTLPRPTHPEESVAGAAAPVGPDEGVP